MKSAALLLAVAVSFVPAAMIHAQVSDMIPPEGRGMLDSADRASPEAVWTRKRYVDSLEAGRARWRKASVTEYRIQTHVNCFCAYRPDEPRQINPLLHIRNNTIIAREPGKPIDVPADTTFTVDRLFTFIENDARDVGRRIKKLILDPSLGFPRQYEAQTAGIPDLWVIITVDSFSVVRRAKPRSASPGPK